MIFNSFLVVFLLHLSAIKVNGALMPARATYPDCYFAAESVNDVNFTVGFAINSRCRSIDFSQIASKSGRTGVRLIDRRCGVLNNTTPDLAGSSDICLSQVKIVTALVHRFRMGYEHYYEDYADVKKKRFKNKRAEIENQFNEQFLNSSAFTAAARKFERATLLAIHAKTDLDFPALDKGVEIELLVQFAAAVTDAEYRADFEALLADWPDRAGIKTLGSLKLDGNETFYNMSYYDPARCGALSSMQSRIPVNLWNNSDLNGASTFAMGSSVDLTCKAGYQLTTDEDGFDKEDNVYNLMCTTVGRYDEPYNWPTCVPYCGELDPPHDDLAGMHAVLPEITIPMGKAGEYMCNDTTLGVEQAGTSVFEVKCIRNRTANDDDEPAMAAMYDYPPNGSWPHCRPRTTTMSPVLPVAVKSMLDKHQTDLEWHVLVTQYDKETKETENHDYMKKVALPWLGGLALAILLCCCCTRKDSPICLICSDKDTFDKLGE